MMRAVVIFMTHLAFTEFSFVVLNTIIPHSCAVQLLGVS